MNFSATALLISSQLATSLAVTIFTISMCALVAIPWLAAHMRFWGRRNGKKSYFTSADLLVRISMLCLSGVFIFGMLSFHLVSLRHSPALMTAIILMAPLSVAVPLLCFVWGAFCTLSKKTSRWSENDLLYLVAAGVAAVGASVIVTALIAGAVDDSLWRDMRKDFISVFFSSSFLFGFVVALLSSFLVGGILLMLIGRRSFYWERGVSVSEGAFLIQMGAAPSLFAVILLVAWVSGWWLFDGLVPLRAIIYSSDIVLLSLSGVLVVGVVVLVEMLASVLKKKGNAPRTSFAVAVLLFVTVFSATSLFGMPDSPGALGQSQKASKAMKQNLPGAR
ncbi:MAG: hypothetical protein HOJ95_16785 [Nitrospinaceae bacterium]|jgi:hypothetical protein|nr:hypothetical protein [Nitrospinaceae bacterium]MBT3820072.1 hypothetical protein [Nitrospinaceae bacterium]MBT5368228.1 hypothetical protein [Nitrospinaceae bacterium]MBT6396354.1 hypothetical protein [Nitrospinaceae bacterium]